MRIGWILNSYCVCGGVKIVFEFSKRLAEKGHEIFLIYQIGNGKLWYDFNENVKSIHWQEALKNKLFNNIDAIIATFWTTAYDLDKLNTDANKYYLVQQRESNFYLNQNEKQLVEKTYDLPLKIITISSWLQDFLTTKHNKDSYLLRYGLDTNKFYPDPDPELIATKKKYTILNEGHPTNHWKNCGILYDIFKNEDIDIWSLSTEPEKRSTKHFQNPPQEMIRRIYSSADVVVKPSLSEGLSAIPAEAMASGVPCIAPDIPGMSDYVIHEYNGLLVKPTDKQAIKDAVMRLKNDPELANKLRINGLKTIHEKFQWEDKVDLLEDILSRTNKLKSLW